MSQDPDRPRPKTVTGNPHSSSEDAEKAADLMRELAAQLVKLTDELSKHRREQNTGAVRVGYMKCLLAVHRALQPVIGSERLFFTADILLALYAAIVGHRHWLTALPQDTKYSKNALLPVWRGDPLRNILIGYASALLHHYSRTGNQLSIATKIADAMGQGGFTTDRGEAPKAGTIKDWRNNLTGAKKRKRRPPDPAAAGCFEEQRQRLGKLNCKLSDELELLKKACQDVLTLPTPPKVKLKA